LQIFRAEALLHSSSMLAQYQRERVSGADSAVEMLRRYELPREEIVRIVGAIRSANMLPIATPFSPDDVKLIHELDLPAVKIASPDLVNRPLLEAVARTERPMIVSTGAATMEEVEATFAYLTEMKARFALLHCVSSYPTRAADANLIWIIE